MENQFEQKKYMFEIVHNKIILNYYIYGRWTRLNDISKDTLQM